MKYGLKKQIQMKKLTMIYMILNSAHLHDLKMQYNNQILKQIVLEIPKLLKPHELDVATENDYVVALQF